MLWGVQMRTKRRIVFLFIALILYVIGFYYITYGIDLYVNQYLALGVLFGVTATALWVYCLMDSETENREDWEFYF